MPERFKVVLDHARRYTSARLYLFTFTSPLVITSFKTKLAAAILVVVVVRRRGSAGPVLPLWGEGHRSRKAYLCSLCTGGLPLKGNLVCTLEIACQCIGIRIF